MKKIESMGLVCDSDPNKFLSNINEHIENYQSKGLEVDIQYSFDNITFSAFIIGRK